MNNNGAIEEAEGENLGAPAARDEPADEGHGAPVPEHMRIEDTEAWFRINTLRERGEPTLTLGQQEDVARFEQLQDYQQTVMGKMFADAEAEAEQQRAHHQKQVESLEGGTIVFDTSDGKTESFPLVPFARSCDTVFALATSWDYEQSKQKQVVCKLLDFSKSSTLKFALCVMGKMRLEELDADSIVDMCCIADYLQNTGIRDTTEEILKQSIDAANCLSICQLADQLGMPTLFEFSLQHMMQSLGTIDEGSDCWEEMTPDLREQVMIIKAAIQSSVHSQRSKLYFNSLDEYISIFSEKVQYYRERLAEAKDQVETLRPGSHLWVDTQMKIYKQEQRVRTLSAALAEQKKVFGPSQKSALRVRLEKQKASS